MMLYTTALDVAPRGVFEKRKFLRPMTNDLMVRSARLLSSSRRPSFKNAVSFSHWF